MGRREHKRSYHAGWSQRDEDNKAGGALRGREVSGGQNGRAARDERAFTRGYEDRGDSEFDWM